MTAELILHLGEMDARRLHVGRGFSSLFSYCVEELHFSEDEACRRIDAARLARKFPSVHSLLSGGFVSLTVLGLLKPHLTSENHEALLALVSGASVRETKERLAAQFPRPDVPSMIRKLPEPRTMPTTAPAPGPASALAPAIVLGTEPSALARIERSSSPCGHPELFEARVGAPTVPPGLEAVQDRGRLDPLARHRFLVKFTASRAVKEKLELARDLMRHGNPGGELAIIFERALDLL
ncbi:MAG TPA: hypothetical protein VF395_03085, partial [Polyangiaceae bacterium]